MNEDSNFSNLAIIVTSVTGTVAFLENTILFVLIANIMLKLEKQKKTQPDVLVHVFFVCINDTLNGIVMFLISVIRINDATSAFACAYVIILLLSLQITSQGNITCICIQRYFIARTIRTPGSKRQTTRTFVLVLINFLIGTTSFATCAIPLKIRQVRQGSQDMCSYAVVANEQMGLINMLYYLLGLILTLVSDAMCLLTICRLRKELTSVVQPERTTTISKTEDTYVQHITCASKSAKQRQQKATITIILILGLFNVSVFPVLILHSLSYIGIEMSLQSRRLIFLTLFMNSLFNPIIICTRIHEIQKMIRSVAIIIRKRFE